MVIRIFKVISVFLIGLTYAEIQALNFSSPHTHVLQVYRTLEPNGLLDSLSSTATKQLTETMEVDKRSIRFPDERLLHVQNIRNPTQNAIIDLLREPHDSEITPRFVEVRVYSHIPRKPSEFDVYQSFSANETERLMQASLRDCVRIEFVLMCGYNGMLHPISLAQGDIPNIRLTPYRKRNLLTALEALNSLDIWGRETPHTLYADLFRSDAHVMPPRKKCRAQQRHRIPYVVKNYAAVIDWSLFENPIEDSLEDVAKKI